MGHFYATNASFLFFYCTPMQFKTARNILRSVLSESRNNPILGCHFNVMDFFNLELFFVVRLFRKQDLLIISREVVLLCSTTLPISQLWRIPTQYSVAKGPNYIWYVKNHNEQSLILWKALSATVQYMHKCIELKALSV